CAGAGMNNLLNGIRVFAAKAVGTTHAALREIFDEAAYSRFLSRAGMVSSSEAYAAFRREFEEAKMRRPKCC
ncbi:MAG: hypothetical protein WBV98_23680, partial [Candidatus Sulfotelmatobacter sp.]